MYLMFEHTSQMSVIDDAMPLHNSKVQLESKTRYFSLTHPSLLCTGMWLSWRLSRPHLSAPSHKLYTCHILFKGIRAEACNSTVLEKLYKVSQVLCLEGKGREKGWGCFGFGLTSFSLISYLEECFPWLFLLSFFRSVWERSRESCFSLCSDW